MLPPFNNLVEERPAEMNSLLGGKEEDTVVWVLEVHRRSGQNQGTNLTQSIQDPGQLQRVVLISLHLFQTFLPLFSLQVQFQSGFYPDIRVHMPNQFPHSRHMKVRKMHIHLGSKPSNYLGDLSAQWNLSVPRRERVL